MKILRFLDFVNEMESSKSYKEMTAFYPDREKRSMSKSIIEPKTISGSGWSDLLLVNEDGRVINSRQPSGNKYQVQELMEGFLFNNKELVKEVPNILAKTLHYLANNQILSDLDYKKFRPTDFLILDLGKISMYNGEFYLYPVFVPSSKWGDLYRGGHLYAVAGKSILFSTPELQSFFYSKGPEQVTPPDLAREAFASLNRIRGTKFSKKNFMESHEIIYPYGKDFEVTIDFTKQNANEILKNVYEQITSPAGSQSSKSAEKTIGSQTIGNIDRESLQLSLKVGKEVGLIVPYISKDKFTTVKIDEIINLREIQNAVKFRKGLSEIQEIIVAWTYSGEEKPKTFRSSLKRGSRIKWKPKGGEIVEGKITTDPSFIAPNAKMLADGIVPLKITI